MKINNLSILNKFNISKNEIIKKKEFNMSEITVSKKEELEEAKNKGYEKIIIKGELADKLHKTKKITTLSKTSLALIIGVIGAGVALTPFSGGTSLAISGITATGVGITTGVGATAIILAASLGIALILAIYKDYEEISYKDKELILRKKQIK